jgi:hypothetical protein
MILIFLLYVLPLMVNILGLYYIIKKENGTVKTFLGALPYLVIPGISIVVLAVGIYFTVKDWIENNDKWQDFLNRKL